jgi:DNA-binding CsgD family transcriptional regulator
VLVPQGPTGTIAAARQRLAKALAEGKSAAEAARLAGMTERTAFRSRARSRRRDDNQGRLF